MKSLLGSNAGAVLYLAVSAVVGVALTAMAEEASAETYLCVTDMTTGFDPKSSGGAEYKRFSQSKYIIKEVKGYEIDPPEYTHEVVEMGERVGMYRSTLCKLEEHSVYCKASSYSSPISSFMMDKETGKFMLASFGTAWRSNKKNGHASEYIARGKCERID
jgi:hypothetical protein